MRIIDTHSHLWLRQDTVVNDMPIRTLENGRSLFMGEIRQMVPPFIIDGRNTAEIFLSNMDYAQVTAAVVVQEFIDGLQNDYLADVQKRYPDRFIVCGMADYRQPGYLEHARQLMAQGFKGIAIPGHRLQTPTGRVRLTCPEMMFGMVTVPGWMEQIRLARHKNVMIESGGITWLFNDEFYPFKGAVKAIREAADEVGMDKLMWGSDYPRTITAITYRMSYDFILKTDELTEHEKEQFLGMNAVKFYNIKTEIDLPYIKNMSE